MNNIAIAYILIAAAHAVNIQQSFALHALQQALKVAAQ